MNADTSIMQLLAYCECRQIVKYLNAKHSVSQTTVSMWWGRCSLGKCSVRDSMRTCGIPASYQWLERRERRQWDILWACGNEFKEMDSLYVFLWRRQGRKTWPVSVDGSKKVKWKLYSVLDGLPSECHKAVIARCRTPCVLVHIGL